MKKLHWTDSEFDRTYFLWDRNLYIIIITIISVDNAVYDSSGFSVFADSHLPFGVIAGNVQRFSSETRTCATCLFM